MYVWAALLYLGLRVISDYRLWPVAFVSNALHLFLLLAVPALAYLLWMRRWRRAVLAGIPVLAWLCLFGVLFLPQRSVPCQDSCTTITVLTFNVAHTQLAADTLTDYLQDTPADIVALQEVIGSQAAAIGQILANEYPYQAIGEDAGRNVGLLSVYPIETVEFLTLNARPYLRADLVVEGRLLIMVVAHPNVSGFESQPLRYMSRSSEAIGLLAEMAVDGVPIILAGDFNMIDQSPDYDLLRDAGLTDSFRAAGWGLGLTYPTSHAQNAILLTPFLRIDYIWHSQQLETRRAWIAADAGSDPPSRNGRAGLSPLTTEADRAQFDCQNVRSYTCSQ